MRDNNVLNDRMTHAPKEERIKSESTSFSQKQITFADTPLFFPSGFEKIFLAIYFIILPYITGLLFLFLYVAKAKIELFLSLNEDSSFLLTWTIGYEIMAVFILLYIIKLSIGFATSVQTKNQRFQRP